MPRFEPFRAVHYDFARFDPARVTAPPYDVISPEQRDELASDPYNVVHLDLPTDDPDGTDRYTAACRRLHRWLAEGVLVRESEPGLWIYRMTFTDPAGRPRHTHGVIGAMEVADPDAGTVLPHELTTPKARSDRLEMLRSCRANLSAVWGLSLAEGLTGLLEPRGAPVAAWTSPDDGVTHELWPMTDPERTGEVSRLVASRPVVIADGHHRYETALRFRDEQRAVRGPGPWDLVLTWLVELAPEELTILPIHRIVTGLPEGVDLPGALAGRFDVTPLGSGPFDRARIEEVSAVAPVVVTAAGAWKAVPRGDRERFADLDTAAFDEVLRRIPGHTEVYEPDLGAALEAVRRGEADAAVLVRPVTMDQIRAVATEGLRMPPKSTFFWPKPRTGTVFRLLDEPS